MSAKSLYRFPPEGPSDLVVYTSPDNTHNVHGRPLKLSEIQNEKPHSPSHNHKRIAEQLYKASIKGHNFINEHYCISKRCSNPGCGAFLRTAGQHICVHAHQSHHSRGHSRGGRRTRRTRRTLRIRR